MPAAIQIDTQIDTHTPLGHPITSSAIWPADPSAPHWGRRGGAYRVFIPDPIAAQPIIDVPAAQQLTGKSHVAVGNAIAQLEQAGILRKLNERKWGRVWECGELLALIDEFERNVSTP